jgi:predicted membrane-bound mannosyltransferase/DNA-binding beta-propeller fold protein YncE
MDTDKLNWLERPVHPALKGITNEVAIFAFIMAAALVTRFFDLESRVMSHDESLHTYFSWLLFRGQGYEHTPMMHGPLQFHLLALTYFLLGVSDFTARIPAVLFSIATVWMVWYWRRYLGKTGALVAALLMVISPFMLYYGRYVRNEAFAGFSGILMLFAILRFLETGGKRYLYLVITALIIHFTSKETSFIYSAQALIFLSIYFVARITRKPWKGHESQYRSFLIALIFGILLIGSAIGYGVYEGAGGTLTNTETAMPANPDAPLTPLAMTDGGNQITPALAGLGILILIFAAGFLVSGYSWTKVKQERSFSLIILLGTLILPVLTPLPIKLVENWLHVSIPTTAAEVSTMMASPAVFLGLPRDLVIVGIFILLTFILSVIIGQAWNRDWWKYAAYYWGVFVLLYTAVFTNSDGFFTGLLGSLGYWLVQQGVQRGSQPWYFYVLIQIPIYEFLPALGTLLAAYLGIKKLTTSRINAVMLEEDPEASGSVDIADPDEEFDEDSRRLSADSPTTITETVAANFTTTFSLLIWWVVSSILALSYAGERMPWLTYHIAWPMILISGWGLGNVIDSINWPALNLKRIFLTLLFTTLAVISLAICINSLSGPTPPFQAKDISSLRATNAFLLPAFVLLASIFALYYLMRPELSGLYKTGLFMASIIGTVGTIASSLIVSGTPEALSFRTLLPLAVFLISGLIGITGLILLRSRPSGEFPKFVTLTVFGLLAVLTARAAFRTTYENYDSAAEYLVYAHGAGPIKEVMAQAEEISRRTTGGMDMILSYDASAPDTGVSWPFVWYLRDFTNQRAFDQPTKSVRESPFVVVDAKNFDKIEPALGPGYYRFDYIRMWWPNQDYFGLDRYRITEAIRNPQIRAGIWDIWFNRDYTRYAQATGHTDLTPTTWQPSDAMRLYIRKDVASMIWNFGTAPSEVITIEDPTEGKQIQLAADLIIDETTTSTLTLNGPRSLAFAPDGSFYVADSRNHRVVHLDRDGLQLESWGTFADGLSVPAPIGTFNEPWGIAVGPDGSVFVSDTWNHRIQKFSKTGVPIKTWGQYGTAEQIDGFWGPRGIAIDSKGYVYIADTGNKRIIVFDSNGIYQAEFGTAGLGPGQFDEPVGIAIDENDILYVTDTWNQRIQTFSISPDRTSFAPQRQWDVFGWFGQSLDNKPFIAVNSIGHVFVTDPEQYRVIEFSETGEVVRTWGDFGDSPSTFGLTSGIAVDPEGHIWVTDALYNRILRFTLP